MGQVPVRREWADRADEGQAAHENSKFYKSDHALAHVGTQGRSDAKGKSGPTKGLGERGPRRDL